MHGRSETLLELFVAEAEMIKPFISKQWSVQGRKKAFTAVKLQKVAKPSPTWMNLRVWLCRLQLI